MNQQRWRQAAVRLTEQTLDGSILWVAAQHNARVAETIAGDRKLKLDLNDGRLGLWVPDPAFGTGPMANRGWWWTSPLSPADLKQLVAAVEQRQAAVNAEVQAWLERWLA